MTGKTQPSKVSGTATDQTAKEPVCGVVMPISPIDGCSAEHWSEVLSIIRESVESISEHSFNVKLVSDADEVGVIHKRIVQNIYSSDIVVCDVSAKNPNVMFELGMRLAFDKATVIIKDDKTDYSFDTSSIEHIPYPRDLRFNKVRHFKEILANKIRSTYEESKSNANYSTFLKNFGQFNTIALSESSISPEAAIADSLTDLQAEILRLRRFVETRPNPIRYSSPHSNPRTRRLIEFIRKNFRDTSRIEILSILEDEKKIKFIEDAVEAPSIYTDQEDFFEDLVSAVHYVSRNSLSIKNVNNVSIIPKKM